MAKWTTHSQKHWDSIGTGIIGLGVSLLMVGAVVSLAFQKTPTPIEITQATQSQTTTQVASAPPTTSTRVQ